MNSPLAHVEQSLVSTWIREGIWPFALTNTLHILGLGLLIGSITLLDLRLIGVRRQGTAAALGRLCIPVAAAGLVLASITGLMMFSASPREYLQNPFFIPKLALFALAAGNAALLHMTAWRSRHAWGDGVPPRVRLSGAASLTLWVAVIACGRLLAYF